jgi:S-formylglutathione hydrolase FrmB
MQKRIIVLLFFVYLISYIKAATVDTVSVYSSSMKKKITTVVVLPDSYNETNNIPAVYLLHGYGDNYSTWLKEVPHIKELADLYNFIIIMPDGAKSWYWDSPVDSKVRYETFISSELVNYIDKNYKTIKNRKARAITGNSMGGQGALFIAFRHQDTFSTAGSLSGGVDIRPFPSNWSMADNLGAFNKYPERWNSFAVINQLWRLVPGKLSIIIDCGRQDFFHQVNINLHNKLSVRNIPHVFIENDGQHTWEYWNEEIDFQFLFFHNHLEYKTAINQ